jgi:hypothetical protein
MASLHLVACSDNISRVKKQVLKAVPCPIPYIFLGKDFFCLRMWEQKLGSRFVRLDISRLLDGVADEIKEEHVQWLDHVNKQYGQDLEWWFGTISTRHLYESNLFQYCCYLETLRRLWKGGQRRPYLIVVESWGLATAVAKWAQKNEIAVTVGSRWAFYQDFCKRIALSFLKWGYFAGTVVVRTGAAHASLRKAPPKDPPAGQVAIVDTFVHESCWSPNGTYKDRYFPGLFDFLRAQGFQVLIHPVLHGVQRGYWRVYRRMREASENFIIPEDFLKVSDYLRALTLPLRLCKRKISAAPFRGFDVQDILWEEKFTEGNTSSLLAVLIYRLFLRLGKTGLNPRIIINWHENQMIDKALIAGARQAFPETTIIGAQIFVRLAHLIHLSPSRSETEASVTPHLFLGASEHQCQAIQAFTRRIPCEPAAALRYSYMFERVPGKSDDDCCRDEILVLLPFLLEDAFEMVAVVKSALEDFPEGIPVWVKCHPDYSPNRLLRLFGSEPWPSSFFIFEGSLVEALQRARVVISHSSGVALEALARGIPVLSLVRQTSITPRVKAIEDISLLKECFSRIELVADLKKIFHEPKRDARRHIKEGRKIRELFFTPVNPQTMAPYLGIGVKR